MAAANYVIRGGREGRERLRILARVMWPETRVVLEPLVSASAACLDVGCGGGDVTFELARLAPDGIVVGVDIDETKLALARDEAANARLRNVEFRSENVLEPGPSDERFDVVYVRFVLSHLPDPGRVLQELCTRLAPGGVLVVEDIDSSGQYWYPPSEAFRRNVELYDAIVLGRGADPYIGPKLPAMLQSTGLVDLGVRTTQPTALHGDVKLLAPITFDAIAATIADQGLASSGELARLSDELWTYSLDPTTVSSIPRVVQAWGRRSSL
jgi:SAM-dependent methyltransferase